MILKDKSLKLWFYGTPYSGKSTFAYQFKKAFVINTDGNSSYTINSLGNKSGVVHCEQITDYKAVPKILEKACLCKDTDTIIIDLIDGLIELVRESILIEKNVEHESMAPHGIAWGLVKNRLLRVLLPLKMSKKDVIFISHQQERLSENTQVELMKPIISDKHITHISGMTQLIGRIYKQHTKYMMSFGATSNELAGTRIDIKAKTIECTYEKFLSNLGVTNDKKN